MGCLGGPCQHPKAFCQTPTLVARFQPGGTLLVLRSSLRFQHIPAPRGRLQTDGILQPLAPQGLCPPHHPSNMSLGPVLLGKVCSWLMPGPAEHLGESQLQAITCQHFAWCSPWLCWLGKFQLLLTAFFFFLILLAEFLVFFPMLSLPATQPEPLSPQERGQLSVSKGAHRHPFQHCHSCPPAPITVAHPRRGSACKSSVQRGGKCPSPGLPFPDGA